MSVAFSVDKDRAERKDPNLAVKESSDVAAPVNVGYSLEFWKDAVSFYHLNAFEFRSKNAD